MNIVFMGTPEFALPTLKKIYNSSHSIMSVVTQPDRPKGRGQIKVASPIKNFAIENNMIHITDDVTSIKVNMLNSNNVCELIMQTPNGKLSNEGNAQIDGVSGTSAPIICNYLDVAGSVCGSLFPTGNKKDFIEGINITCIDNGMPVVLINSKELGITGYESCDELTNNNIGSAIYYEKPIHMQPIYLDYGLNLPRWLQISFSGIVQNQAGVSGGEVSSEAIWQLFNQVYITPASPPQTSVRLGTFEHKRTTHDRIKAQLLCGDETLHIYGEGHGVIDAFAQALKEHYGLEIDIQEYNEHALQEGSDAEAISYVQVSINGQRFYGVAIHEDTVTASLNAILSATNQFMFESQKKSEHFLKNQSA